LIPKFQNLKRKNLSRRSNSFVSEINSASDDRKVKEETIQANVQKQVQESELRIVNNKSPKYSIWLLN